MDDQGGGSGFPVDFVIKYVLLFGLVGLENRTVPELSFFSELDITCDIAAIIK